MSLTKGSRIVGLVSILILAAALRSHLTSGGAVLPRHDEAHYVDPVVGFLGGHWKVTYFVNPTLYAYVLFAATAMVGWARVLLGHFESFEDFVFAASLDPTTVVLVARSLTLALALVSVVLVYVIARRAFSERVGWIAALAFAVEQTHVKSSGLAGNETLLVMLLLAFFLALQCYVAHPTARRHALAGLLLGLATSTKYSGAIHVITLFAGTWIVACAVRTTPGIKGTLRALARPAQLVGYVCVPLAFLAASPWIVLDFARFREQFEFQSGFLSQGYSASDIANQELGWIKYVREFPVETVGLPFAIACALGLALAAYRAVRYRETAPTLLLAATLPAYLYLGSGIFSRMRFLLIAIPFLLVLGAWAVDRLVVVSSTSIRRDTSERTQLIAGIALAVLLLAPHARQTERRMRRLYANDSNAELLAWIREQIEPGAVYVDVTSPATNRFFTLTTRATALTQDDLSSDSQRAILRDLRSQLVASKQLYPLLKQSEDLSELRARIEARGATRLIVTVTMKGKPREAEDERAMLRRALRGIARSGAALRTVGYWDEVVEYLASLPVRAFTVGADRRTVVCVLELV